MLYQTPNPNENGSSLQYDIREARYKFLHSMPLLRGAPPHKQKFR